MLQTDEVDDDYFTPIPSTSLASIFGNIAQNKEDNEKLKYTPPKPQSTLKQTSEAKATECLFACALTGYEWSNNVYSSRGKIGFAIIKTQISGVHNIVLYDSRKATLSCSVISSTLEIAIKNNTYISYYDNVQKYWSLYGSIDDIKKIVEILTKFSVIIKESTNSIELTGPPELKKNDQDLNTQTILEHKLESDTDSSVNRKTKASILNRMANMGQSVFPTITLPAEGTSDSSDINETDIHPKIVRHKPMKSVVKRNNPESYVQSEHLSESYKRNTSKTEVSADNTVLQTSISRQLVPVPNTNILAGVHNICSNEMGTFMSEQRVSNSELRINMNRITDKVDLILDKINHLEPKATNVETEIVLKLLAEYENKIKVYEELLKKSNHSHAAESILPNEHHNNETEMLKKTVEHLEQTNKEKNDEILFLQSEIKLLKAKYAEKECNQMDNEDVLLKKISYLESNLSQKNEELMDIMKKCDILSSRMKTIDTELGIKLKNIMNDTFQTISVNFENNSMYSGETVKKIIASVIKKITVQSINQS